MVSDQQLIEDLKEFADEFGRTPTFDDMDNCGPWSGMTYHRHFGSWNDALKRAKLCLNQNISKEKLISDLQEFSDKFGKVPTSREMDKFGPWSLNAYSRKFGSWNNALREANLSVNKELNISKERLISDLQEFTDELGRTPTEPEMKKRDGFGVKPYKRKFGSWNNALREANLSVNKELNISKERLISDLQEFADELGRTPTSIEMNQFGPWSMTAYRNNFSSWNVALRSAGLEINCLGPSERAGIGEDCYGRGWNKIRKETVERDGGKCRICGDGVVVHVHHIKPRREFDDVSNSNTLDNLITLCPSHHAKFEGLWKDATPDEFEKKAKELIQ